MSDTIFAAIISAGGAIVAAVLAAFFAGQIVLKKDSTIFLYIFEKNLRPILQRAKHNIVIIAPVGDSLINNYGSLIREMLSSGIHVYFLLQKKEYLYNMDIYLRGATQQTEVVVHDLHDQVLEKLRTWKK